MMRRQAQATPASLPAPRPSRDRLRESEEPTVAAPLSMPKARDNLFQDRSVLDSNPSRVKVLLAQF